MLDFRTRNINGEWVSNTGTLVSEIPNPNPQNLPCSKQCLDLVHMQGIQRKEADKAAYYTTSPFCASQAATLNYQNLEESRNKNTNIEIVCLKSINIKNTRQDQHIYLQAR